MCQLPEFNLDKVCAVGASGESAGVHVPNTAWSQTLPAQLDMNVKMMSGAQKSACQVS